MEPRSNISAESLHEAGVAALKPEQIVIPDSDLWAAFADATTLKAYCETWLALQCRMLNGVLAGMVLVGEPNRGPFSPLAVWPHRRRSLKHLGSAAERAMTERRGLVLKPDAEEGDNGLVNQGRVVAYPIEVRDRLYGAVVLEMATQDESGLQTALRRLHWGVASLELWFCRDEVGKERASRERLQMVLDLIATAVGYERFYAAAMAFVTALATRLQCDRVSMGVWLGRRTHVRAMSHSAQFKKQTNLLRAMAAAMDEALDQHAAIHYPPLPGAPPFVTRAHAELVRQHDAGIVYSIPLHSAGKPSGVLLLEWPADRPFDEGTRDLCDAVAALAGPCLETLRRDDRWLIQKAVDRGRLHLSHVIGAHHVGLKLSVLGVAALLSFFTLATGEYRVSAKTVLEPSIKRAIAAPFKGFITEAKARAGDVVAQGQFLCALDDRDLRLERLKALSQQGELEKQYHKAMAEHKASEAEVFTAQVNQAKAQQALLEEQLSRTRILAPFDGVVVSGDLSQSLGSPTDKGDVLFELAPLDAYRVIVQVDERDIADVAVGQQGTVILSALPNDQMPVTVTKITPVSEAKEGRNYFRVEARFDDTPLNLRPAMEGVGKISIDERRLMWIWTHQAVDWVRLTVWSWWP